MIQDSSPISLSARANVYAFSQEEKKRREAASKNKDYYYGRQVQYIGRVNDDVDPVMVNLTGPITTKRASLLYNRPLVRIFDGPPASVKAIQDLYYKINIDHILKTTDLLTEVTGTALVFVGLDDNGEITLINYDASDFTPVPNGIDNQGLEALSLISTFYDVRKNGGNITVVPMIKTQIWTDNYVYMFTDGVQFHQEPNELGFIPFVSFKGEEVPHQYLGHSQITSIRKLNEAINQALTNMGYMVKMQSATPIVLTGFTNGEGLSVHPGTAISLPNGATAEALNLSPKILETLEVVKYLEEKIYQTSSIPRIAIVGDFDQRASGIQLMIQWAPLVSVFKDKAARFQRYELQLANMILRVLGLEPITNIQVVYPEETILPVDVEDETLERDIKLGIKTPMNKVLKLQPTLSETEAEAEVLANIAFNKNLGGLDVRQSEQSGTGSQSAEPTE